MAISIASLQRQSRPKPPRIWVYGTAGIGKTTLGTYAPAPVFIQTEDSHVEVATFGVLKTYSDVTQAIGELIKQPHDFKTIVLDSVDWLEPLIHAETCRINKWNSIEDPGYGKGFAAALEVWREFLEGLNIARDEREMGIILIGHAEIKKFDSPETEPYDRYQPKLQKSASALVQEHVDALLFANYMVSTTKADAGFNRKAVRGVGNGTRHLYTIERPAFLAKNRYNMPDRIPLEWAAVEGYVPYYSGQKAIDAQHETTEKGLA
jgi:hypothetical protein